jgi:tetratricopeptide (TPR) repeat protein
MNVKLCTRITLQLYVTKPSLKFFTSIPQVHLHRPLKNWLDPDVKLKNAPICELQSIFSSLCENLPIPESESKLREVISHKAFESVQDQVFSGNLENARSLLAIAVEEKYPPALLYAAKLFLRGSWVIPSHSLSQNEKEKGQKVIAEIRQMQRANKKGIVYYTLQPPINTNVAKGLLIQLKSTSLKGEALIELGDMYYFPSSTIEGNITKEEALESYNEATKTSCEEDAWFRLGCVYEIECKDKNAIDCFHKVLDLNPKNDEAHFHLGHLYKCKDEIEKAKKHLYSAEDLNNVQSIVYLARWDLTNGNEMEARKRLIRASSKEFTDYEAMELLAELLINENLNESLHLYLVSGMEGKRATSCLSAGALLYRIKDYKAAFDCYNRATEYDDVEDNIHKEVWIRLADLYEQGKGVEKNLDTADQIRKQFLLKQV